jgi:hypothetical protein
MEFFPSIRVRPLEERFGSGCRALEEEIRWLMSVEATLGRE